MNIKLKLMEQLEVLKNLQLLATNDNKLRDSLSASSLILQYIVQINSIEPDEEDGCKACVDDYICSDCQDEIMKRSLHQDIANACDMPIEVVNRVMAGQDKVLDLD